MAPGFATPPPPENDTNTYAFCTTTGTANFRMLVTLTDDSNVTYCWAPPIPDEERAARHAASLLEWRRLQAKKVSWIFPLHPATCNFREQPRAVRLVPAPREKRKTPLPPWIRNVRAQLRAKLAA